MARVLTHVVALLIVSLLRVMSTTPVYGADAENPSFAIALLPVTNRVFDEDEAHFKVRGTYLRMKETGPGTPFEISGYGVDFAARKAFTPVLALDGGVGVTGLDGDMGTGSTAGSAGSADGVIVSLTLNLEVQPIKTDFFSVIMFAGPQISFSYLYVDYEGGYSDIDSYVYGLQAGGQIGLAIMDTIGIDVFGMILSQKGSQDVYASTLFTSDSQSYDIPSYTTTSFGADLEFIPWGVTLSSLVQEAGKSDSNGSRTRMYQFSWIRKF